MSGRTDVGRIDRQDEPVFAATHIGNSAAPCDRDAQVAGEDGVLSMVKINGLG